MPYTTKYSDIDYTKMVVKSSGSLALVNRNGEFSGTHITEGMSSPRLFKDGNTHRRDSGKVAISDFYRYPADSDAKWRDWLPAFYAQNSSAPNYDIPTSEGSEIKFSDFYGARYDRYDGHICFTMRIRKDSATGNVAVGGWYENSISDWNSGEAWWGSDLTSSGALVEDNGAGPLSIEYWVSASGSGTNFLSWPGMTSTSWRISGIVSEKYTPSGGTQGAPATHTFRTYLFITFASNASNAINIWNNSNWTFNKLRARSNSLLDSTDDDFVNFTRTVAGYTKAGKTIRYRWQGQVSTAASTQTYNFYHEQYAPFEFTTHNEFTVSFE